MTIYLVNIEATGKNIKRLCLRHGYTVADIVVRLGKTSMQSVYKWFSGKNLPSLDNLVTLSYLLDVTLEEMLVVDEISYEKKGENES